MNSRKSEKSGCKNSNSIRDIIQTHSISSNISGDLSKRSVTEHSSVITEINAVSLLTAFPHADEILLAILCMLDPKSLLLISLTCKTFRELISSTPILSERLPAPLGALHITNELLFQILSLLDPRSLLNTSLTAHTMRKHILNTPELFKNLPYKGFSYHEAENIDLTTLISPIPVTLSKNTKFIGQLEGRVLKIWNNHTGALIKEKKLNKNLGSIREIIFSPQGNYLILLTSTREPSHFLDKFKKNKDKHHIYVWDIKRNSIYINLSNIQLPLHYSDIQFISNDKFTIFGRQLAFYDLKTGQKLAPFKLSPYLVSISPNDKKMLCVTKEGIAHKLEIYDLESNKLVHTKHFFLDPLIDIIPKNNYAFLIFESGDFYRLSLVSDKWVNSKKILRGLFPLKATIADNHTVILCRNPKASEKIEDTYFILILNNKDEPIFEEDTSINVNPGDKNYLYFSQGRIVFLCSNGKNNEICVMTFPTLTNKNKQEPENRSLLKGPTNSSKD